jgi:hypothetical protein
MRIGRPPPEHELLPEALGMLLREFARDGVECAHPFDGYEKRLIGLEARPGQRLHFVSQMALELFDIGGH